MSEPIPLCAFKFPNGVRCQGAARSGFRFCRHHTPEALRCRTTPLELPPPPPRHHPPVSGRPFSRLRYWRAIRRRIAQAPDTQLQPLIRQLMIGLEGSLLSHRCAGALLHQIQKRRRYLSTESMLLRVRHQAHLTQEDIDAALALFR